MTKIENKVTETADKHHKGWQFGWRGLLLFILAFGILIALTIWASPRAEGAQEQIFKVVYTYSPSKEVTYKIIRDVECGTEYVMYESKNVVDVFLRVDPKGNPLTVSKYTGEGVTK